MCRSAETPLQCHGCYHAYLGQKAIQSRHEFQVQAVFIYFSGQILQTIHSLFPRSNLQHTSARHFVCQLVCQLTCSLTPDTSNARLHSLPDSFQESVQHSRWHKRTINLTSNPIVKYYYNNFNKVYCTIAKNLKMNSNRLKTI